MRTGPRFPAGGPPPAASALDLAARARALGLAIRDGLVVVPFFGRPLLVSAGEVGAPDGAPATPAVADLLRDYLARAAVPPRPLAECRSFRDFAGAGPLVLRFADHTHHLIARAFAGRLEDLRQACRSLGAQRAPAPWGADLEMRFEALPAVPLHLAFNDGEEGLPAQCRLLFAASVEAALSPGSRFTLGTYLAGALLRFPAAPPAGHPAPGQSP